MIQPGIDGPERLRIQLVKPAPALAAFANQPGAAQQAQVLGDSRTRNRKGLGDLPGRQAAAAQKVQDGAAGRDRRAR